MAIGPQYVGDTELPWEQGLHRGLDAEEADPSLRPGRWSLTGMSADHQFYSADLLAMTGVISHPVDIFFAENNIPLQEAPFRLNLGRPVLRGLPQPLDHYVYAVPNLHARRLFDFLDRFAAGDPQSAYWESLHQRMELVDWPFVDTLSVMPEKPPTVRIELFGLSGPETVYHWKPPQNPWKESVWLAMTPRSSMTAKDPKTGQRRRRRPFTTS